MASHFDNIKSSSARSSARKRPRQRAARIATLSRMAESAPLMSSIAPISGFSGRAMLHSLARLRDQLPGREGVVYIGRMVAAPHAPGVQAADKQAAKEAAQRQKEFEKAQAAAMKAERSASRSQPADPMNTMLNELGKTMGREMGKSIQRGLFGSLFGRK